MIIDQPSATSSTIIKVKPIIIAHVPKCERFFETLSGIRSSATTNTIAPAEKARRYVYSGW